MKSIGQKWSIIAIVAVVVLISGLVVRQLFFRPLLPQPVAQITMQVNPALQLSLDQENRVIGVAGLDERGKALLPQIAAQNMGLEQTLLKITDVVMEAGFLTPGTKIRLVLHSPEDREIEILPDIATLAQQTITARLVELNIQIEVTSHVINAEMYKMITEKGWLPRDYEDLLEEYEDLIEAGVSHDIMAAIIRFGEEIGIEPELLLEELSTLVAAVIDMVEAGIPEVTALEMLKIAMETDLSLEETTTIVAGVIDMHEAGIASGHILAFLNLHQGIEVLGVKREIFLEEFSTLVAGMIDMREAGITEATALETTRIAMGIDPTLEELSTIIAEMIDLVEANISEAEALDKIRGFIIEEAEDVNDVNDVEEGQVENEVDVNDVEEGQVEEVNGVNDVEEGQVEEVNVEEGQPEQE